MWLGDSVAVWLVDSVWMHGSGCGLRAHDGGWRGVGVAVAVAVWYWQWLVWYWQWLLGTGSGGVAVAGWQWMTVLFKWDESEQY
jgi:hypothetical protein